MAELDRAEGCPPIRVGAYAWYALLVLVLVYVINFIDRQILSILAEDIKKDLGLEDAQIGFLYGTAFAVFYALFGIPLGRLAEGIGVDAESTTGAVGLYERAGMRVLWRWDIWERPA